MIKFTPTITNANILRYFRTGGTIRNAEIRFGVILERKGGEDIQNERYHNRFHTLLQNLIKKSHLYEHENRLFASRKRTPTSAPEVG